MEGPARRVFSLPVALIALAWIVGPACRCGDEAVEVTGLHSLAFDGIDDYVAIDHLPGIDGDGLTVEAWVRPDGPEVPRANILARRDPRGRGDAFLFRIREDMGGVLEFGVANQHEAWGMAGKARIPRQRWTHVAAIYQREEGAIFLYVDGDLDAEGRTPVKAHTGEMPVWLGGDPLRGASARPFAGQIDDLRVWDHARPAAHLKETARLPLRGDEPGLVLLWSMDEGQGQQVGDGAGEPQVGTLGSERGEDPSDPTWSDENPF